MTSRLPLFLALCLALPGLAFAQNLKPLPNPDLSKLTPAQNSELREARVAFDTSKTGRSGGELADLYASLGGLYARAGLLDAADTAFENASLLMPNDDRWLYLRGILARDRGQQTQAREFFEKAFKLNPMYLPARMVVAADRFKAGDAAGARKLLDEQLVVHPDEAVAHALLGEIDIRDKKYADAAKHLRAALNVDPQATSLYRLLAVAEEGAGNAKAAADAKARIGDGALSLEDMLRRRVTQRSADSQQAPAAPQLDARTIAISDATKQASQGQFDAARKILDGSLKKTPNDVEVLVFYAQIEAAAGNAAAARTRARAAVSADPKSTAAWMAQGVILEMDKDDAGARESYQKALALNSKLAGAQRSLGDLGMRTGRSADALAAYRALAVMRPDDVEVWAHVLAAQFAAGQCATGLGEALGNARKHPRDPMFAEIAVRAASTCSAATADQKKKALVDAQELYSASAAAEKSQKAAPQHSARIGEAYALALAANGKWEDAAQTQGASVFIALSAGDQVAVEQYREFYQRFQAKQLPTRPWADSHPLIKPQRPLIGSAAQQAPAAPPPAK